MSRSSADRYFLILAFLVASLGLPRAAAPQGAASPGAAVFRALTDLQMALEGVYGDEGADVPRRLEALSQAAASWDESIREAESRLRPRIAGTNPDDAAFAHEALGSLYLERGRFADAITEFDAAIRLAPQRSSLRLSRGFALEAAGNTDAAAATFRDAWTLDPDNPVTAYLVVARGIGGDTELERAHAVLLRTVSAALGGASSTTSTPFHQSALSIHESGGIVRFPLGRYARGFATAARGQFEEAVGLVREAAARDPLVADPASGNEGLKQATDALRGGSLRAALVALEKAAAASPGSSEAHRLLGTAAALAGDVQKSLEHFQAALRIRPDDERSWAALATTQAESGSLTDAVRTLEKAVAAVLESGALRWSLAGLMVRLEQVADAFVQYSEAERLTPLTGRAAVHQAASTAATLQQDIDTAAAAGERRVRANLNDAAAHRDLASLYLKQGRQDGAVAELAIAAWLDPDDPLTFIALGHTLMAERRDEDAVASLERAVSLQPDLREARYALAQALTRASRRADAERHLAEFERQRSEAVAREQRTLDIAALRDEAAMQSAAGQHQQAVDGWKKVIALEPERAQNYRGLAEALVRAGALEQSLQYFVKTTELDGVAEVHLRLSEVLARLGRTKESMLARETYESLRLEDFRRRARR